jgi:hypothetical protein
MAGKKLLAIMPLAISQRSIKTESMRERAKSLRALRHRTKKRYIEHQALELQGISIKL